ncbi:MAG: ABC transporter permease [Halieaceae bacterium]|jgi:NitT/TauT family transport system permease protein|nr:ABC transporter permease [Halieaceae bacterium]
MASDSKASSWQAVFWPAVIGFAGLGVWYAAVIWGGMPENQLPAPHRILQEGVREAPTLWSGLLQTLYACVLGFTASVMGGVILSILLASSSWAYQGIYPYVLMLKMMPVIVLAPIIIIWFGQGIASITVITFLICFFPIVANTTMGLRSVDRNLSELFQVYSATPRQKMLYLRIPAALPYFFTGLKIAAALTPIGALYGDTVAGMGSGNQAGLGFVVVIFSSQLKVPALFAAALTACAIGFLFVGLVNLLSWWALHRWHDSYLGDEL